MDKDTFEHTLQSFRHREPFEMFVIELDYGEKILVDDPKSFVYNDGAVGFMGPDRIYMFDAGQVLHIRLLSEDPLSVDKDNFEQTVRSYLNRQPFENFVIELDDGQVILVDDPQAFGFGGGSAGIISSDQIYVFNTKQVRQIRPVSKESAA